MVAKEKAKHIRPAFVSEISDLSAYDVVLIGYPVWYQDLPVFVSEFVRQCDLSGKIVIPFDSHFCQRCRKSCFFNEIR